MSENDGQNNSHVQTIFQSNINLTSLSSMKNSDTMKFKTMLVLPEKHILNFLLTYLLRYNVIYTIWFTFYPA